MYFVSLHRPSEACTRYCACLGQFTLRLPRFVVGWGRSWMRTLDFCIAVRCATIMPPLLLDICTFFKSKKIELAPSCYILSFSSSVSFSVSNRSAEDRIGASDASGLELPICGVDAVRGWGEGEPLHFHVKNMLIRAIKCVL